MQKILRVPTHASKYKLLKKEYNKLLKIHADLVDAVEEASNRYYEANECKNHGPCYTAEDAIEDIKAKL